MDISVRLNRLETHQVVDTGGVALAHHLSLRRCHPRERTPGFTADVQATWALPILPCCIACLSRAKRYADQTSGSARPFLLALPMGEFGEALSVALQEIGGDSRRQFTPSDDGL